MSNHKDNTHNKKLRDLLDKTKSTNPPAPDDFEREALEGFSMLGNEEDALDLKNSLDKRIYEEVFKEEKKSGNAYWYAAAGLLLVIGFSVYFVQNNQVSKKEDLAMHTPAEHKPEIIQKSIEERTENNKELKFKAAEPVKAIKSEKQPEARSSGASAGGQAEDVSVQNAPEFAAEQKPITQTKPLQLDREDKKQVMMAPPSAVYASDDADAENKKMTEEVAAKTASPEKDAVVLESVQITSAHRAKKLKEKEAPRAASTPEMKASGASTGWASVVNYNGGPEALTKDLKNKLTTKNLLQEFEATLYINEKGRVEKANLTNSYMLTKKQQKEVIGVLKSLDKFDTCTSGSGLREYKVLFKP